MIENEFGLNDEDYNLINQLSGHTLNDNESFSDEYNVRSSESISPANFKFIDEKPNFNYENEIDSLFKSTDATNYEIDNIENWLDSFTSSQIQPKSDSFKNGFLSLKVKPQRHAARRATNYNQENYLESKKRSSSSTSFQPAVNFLKIIDKPIRTRTNSITIDINDPASSGKHRSLNNKHLDSSQIKIEKKIRLNYNRPQDINSILNFGTLC